MAWGDDNTTAFGFTDPSMMALLGAMQGAGQYSGFSRLPVSTGQVLGGAAGGLLGGIRAGQQYQQGQQEIVGERMKNIAALDLLRRQSAITGQPMPTMQDIQSGNYSFLPDYTKLWSHFMQGGQGTPSAAPQMRGAEAGAGVAMPELPQVPTSKLAPANTK